eukprot:scpid42067/ scgid26317/ Arylsulfatase A; Cerebroside-sulfatase; Arylsulfatase A component B; Arylsulfatase A component C
MTAPLICVCALLVAAKLGIFAPAAADDRPNVILMLSDDWGYGDVGVYGGPHYPRSGTKVRTPNIDTMAREGVIFTDYHTANPVCSPSRAALMTGLFPARVGIHTALNSNAEANKKEGQVNFLNLSVPTVTEHFQKAGYLVGHYGKWHLGGTKTPPSPAPTSYGIDSAVTFNSNDPAHQLGNESAPYWAGVSSSLIIDNAIKLISEATAQKKPFYLNLWFHIAHAKLDPTPEQLSAFTAECSQEEKAVNQTYCPGQIYWASQTDTDTQIGRLMAALKQQGLYNNTLSVFTADNGPEDVMVYHNAQGTTGPWRGRKRSLYEGGHRVPFIGHWPARISAGRVDHSILGGADWFPTAAQMAGIPLSSGDLQKIDGEDMSAAFLNGKGSAPESREKMLFWEWRFNVAGHCWNQAPHLAVRNGTWKFMMNSDGTRHELYEMGNEPGKTQHFELKNVAAANADIVASLSIALSDWLKTLPKGPKFTPNNFGCGTSHMPVIHDPAN